MELKTLKDFVDFVELGKKGIPLKKSSLRQEAIKHAKSLQYYLDTHSFGTVNQNYTESHQAAAEGQISWIKRFFNVTDEELKA